MMADPVIPDPGRTPRATARTRPDNGPEGAAGTVGRAPALPGGVAPDSAAPDRTGGSARPGDAAAAVCGATPMPGVPGAHLVWQQLSATEDPLGHEQIAAAVGLPDGTVLRVLCALGRAGYLLRIPGRNPRDPRQDLWLLAGGVREGRAVDDQSTLTAKRAAQYPDTTGQATGQAVDAGGSVVPFPAWALVTGRARAVWQALSSAGPEEYGEADLARRAGVPLAVARIVLQRLLRLGAVQYTVTATGVRWQAASDYLAVLATPARGDDGAPRSQAQQTRGPDLEPAATAQPVGPVTGNRRLAKGELQAMVLAALQDHSPREFGPTGLAKLLGGYSNGAITNALDRLAARHQIVQTRLAPKRYAALAPTTTEPPGSGR